MILLKEDKNTKALKDAYNQAMTDLNTIQNVTDPTNAQVVWGIKKEAEILEKLLRLIKSWIV